MKELELMARDHKQYPETTSLPDQCYYWTMRSIYDCYRAKKASVDEARAAKRQAVIQYARFSDALGIAEKSNAEREKNIRHIGSLRGDLHKAETLAEKYRIALKAISAMTGESVTEKVEIEWMEKEAGHDP